MKIFVTGCTGFVGRNFLLQLLKENKYDKIYLAVRSLDKLRAQFLEEGYAEMPSQIVPLLAEAPEWEFPKIHVDHVVHSAGVIFGRSKEEYFSTNVEGTLGLLKRLIEPSKVVVLSSISAAGPCRVSEKCKREGDEESPLTWYGQSKLEMERRLAREFPSLNYLCLRPPLIFGPRDSASLPLFRMVRRPLHFKPGFSLKYYSYIGVGDLVQAMLHLLGGAQDWSKLSSRSLFISYPEPATDRALISLAAKVSGKRGVIVGVPQPLLKVASRLIDTIPTWRATIPSLSVNRAKEIWPQRWVCSPQMFEDHFGWRASTEISTALKDSYDWYVKAGVLQ